MRKIGLILIFIGFISCEKNETHDLLPKIPVNVTIDMKLPQYVPLQTVGGWVYINNEGVNGIVVVNRGIGASKYKAFDRACPNNDCKKPMEFDGSLKLKCTCDSSEYSILDGSPQTSKNTHFAREYTVTNQQFLLRITHY